MCSLSTLCLCLFTAIKEKYSDWTEFLIQDLTGSRTAPANLLEGVSVKDNSTVLTTDVWCYVLPF